MINSFFIGDIIQHNLTHALEYLDSDDSREYDEAHFIVAPCVHFPPSQRKEDYVTRWVTYRRTSLEPMFSKDGLHIDKVGFELNIATASYIDSLNAATLVREKFDGARVLTNSDDGDEVLTMKNCRLLNSEEAFDYDSYVQTLEFECEVHSIAGRHLEQLKEAEEKALEEHKIKIK